MRLRGGLKLKSCRLETTKRKHILYKCTALFQLHYLTSDKIIILKIVHGTFSMRQRNVNHIVLSVFMGQRSGLPALSSNPAFG